MLDDGGTRSQLGKGHLDHLPQVLRMPVLERAIVPTGLPAVAPVCAREILVATAVRRRQFVELDRTALTAGHLPGISLSFSGLSPLFRVRSTMDDTSGAHSTALREVMLLADDLR